MSNYEIMKEISIREEEIRLFVPIEYWKLFANTKDLKLEYVANANKSGINISNK